MPSQLSRAAGTASSAAASSSGSMRSSTASSAVHEPSATAAATAASPAGRMSPAAVSRSTRCLLDRDQPLPRLRGVTSRRWRSSSSLFPRLSIHPTHRASSTTSS